MHKPILLNSITSGYIIDSLNTDSDVLIQQSIAIVSLKTAFVLVQYRAFVNSANSSSNHLTRQAPLLDTYKKLLTFLNKNSLVFNTIITKAERIRVHLPQHSSRNISTFHHQHWSGILKQKY